MNITILSINISTQPTKTGGSYQIADVAYRNNTFGAKVEGKKVVSFGTSEKAFKVLAVAQPGDTFDVEQVKENNYNVWTALSKQAGVAAVTLPVTTGGRAVPTVAPSFTKNTYETPEERARKQELIVNQSSIGAAVDVLSIGAKQVKKEDVLALASEFSSWVFSHKPAAGATGFDDVPDFDPEFKPE
jgi:hypothetical protein